MPCECEPLAVAKDSEKEDVGDDLIKILLAVILTTSGSGRVLYSVVRINTYKFQIFIELDSMFKIGLYLLLLIVVIAWVTSSIHLFVFACLAAFERS